METLSVTQVHQLLANAFENFIGQISVQGEISQAKLSPSGHLYLTLKDESASIDCVIFRGRLRRDFQVKAGDKIRCEGKLSTYAPSGRMQFMVTSYERAGLGDLYQQFLALKKKLEDEGLFQVSIKRPIPKFPKVVALVTSSTGSVLRDFRSIVRRRYPGLKIKIFSTLVQGKEASVQMVQALKLAARYSETVTKIDCIVLMRGGGSFEDLFCFNDEQLARTIRSSLIPVISAVGHETDFTIADFVADLRASTPSVAAEILTQGFSELNLQIRRLLERIFITIDGRLNQLRGAVELLRNKLVSPLDRLRFQKQRLKDLFAHSSMAIQNNLRSWRTGIKNLEVMIRAINPSHVLTRGYTITYLEGKVVTSTAEISKKRGDLRVQFHDGSVHGEFHARD